MNLEEDKEVKKLSELLQDNDELYNLYRSMMDKYNSEVLYHPGLGPIRMKW